MSPQPVNSFSMSLKITKIIVQPTITKGFIFELQKLNAEVTIFSQWEQLEKTGCINNFRIIADHNNQFFREGYYFADSDAYKWLDAACRIQKTHRSDKLLEKINIIADLIVRTQEPDGYIFTYNQIHFPGVRWKNLLREHELYCIGHLIEAGISHYKINNENTILNACIKVADLLVNTFLNKRPSSIPGHEEIELALLKLHEITQKEEYLLLAKQFLEQRGKLSFFWIRFLRTNSSTEHRSKLIEIKKQEFYEQNHIPKVILPDNVKFSVPKGIKRKYLFNFATGKYIQSHKPIRKQNVPEGHAVRFSYLVTACAMLNQIQPDKKLLSTLESSWRHMVTKRMFVTGGIGQLPYTEGFDSDYQLDPEFAYCESCAGIGSLLWNWQMTQITCDSAYSDLFEWQLYNAVLPGLSSDGKRYFYRNPLEIKTPYGRKEWYIVACCPPNISRTIASLGEQILTYKNNEVWIHQYFTSQVHINEENEITCILESGFPFNGDVKITITNTGSNNLHIYLRTPSWAKSFEVILNEKEIKLQRDNQKIYKSTASGYNPFSSFYIDMTLESKVKNEISLKFAMPITIIKPDSRVKTVTGKATIARGPIVYCLEDTFNEFDIFSETIIEPSLQIDKVSNKILGKTKNGQNVVFTPYINWATIKDAKMTVFTKIE